MIEETSDLMVRTSETNLHVASKDLTTFGQIIALWPDLTRFAAETGIDYRSAQVMRSRGYINGRYWKRIACAAQARGLWQITPALLAEIGEQEAPSLAWRSILKATPASRRSVSR